jgi:hypothetical protein
LTTLLLLEAAVAALLTAVVAVLVDLRQQPLLV